MRSELRQLAELVAGWDASRDISPLERDLALEKLRRLYEALRFGTDLPAADDAAPVAVPMSIELDDVLVSLSVPEEEAMHGAEAAPENGSESRPPMPEKESGTEPVPHPMPEPEGEDAAEVFEELTVKTAPAREEAPAPAAVPEPEPEAAPEPAFAPTPEPEASLQTESPHAETHPGARPESVSASEFLKSGPASEKPEPAAKPVAPTLFELEDETVRHRRKQRVIMSLYDTEPAACAPKPEPEPKPIVAPTPGPVSGSQSTPSPAVAPIPAEPEPRAIADAKEDETGEPVPEPLAGASAAPEAGFSASESETESRPATVATAPTEPAAGTVLGEVINHDVKTLSDTIAPPRDVASELRRSEPVTDLRRAVGINDKFLLIRDLFGGDGAAYEITIRRLNEFDNFDDCMIYIAENFAWNPNSDGAKLLMELLERKFS